MKRKSVFELKVAMSPHSFRTLPFFSVINLHAYGELYSLFKTLQTQSSTKFFELLFELLKRINFERIVHNDAQAYLRLNRYLSVFGLEVDKNFNLLRSSMISETRKEDRHQMFALLEAYPFENEALKGAIERYSDGGTDAFRQCLDSCRNAIESLVKKLGGLPDWKSGLSEIIPSKNGQDTVKQIYSFLSVWSAWRNNSVTRRYRTWFETI